MLFTKDQHMIQALAAKRPDQAFNIWVLPGRPVVLPTGNFTGATQSTTNIGRNRMLTNLPTCLAKCDHVPDGLWWRLFWR